MTTDQRHPFDTAVGVVLALVGIAFGFFVLYGLFAFAVMSSSDW